MAFESAHARLLVLGPRAVPALLDALDGSCNVLRARAIAVLSLIRDSRAREAIVAQLLDREVRVRVAAALALARFPSEQTIGPLVRTLTVDAAYAVRLAALQSLIAVFEAGYDDAVSTVLDLLFDQSADRRLRHAALGVIPRLPQRQSRAVLRTLRKDADDSIASLAQRIEECTGAGAPDPSALPGALADLGSSRADTWNPALHRLVGYGEAVIAPLVEEMMRRGTDPMYCARAGMVLRGLGPRRALQISDWLEKVDDPLPLEALVEAVDGLADKQLTYRLKDVIERLRQRARSEPLSEIMQRVRARCHLQLARIGSRVAIDDLKELLGEPGLRVPVEILAAVQRIGKRDELTDLLRAWRKEEPFLRSRIREVFLSLMKQERVRRNNRLFSTLSPADRRALREILDDEGSSGPSGGRSVRDEDGAADTPAGAKGAPRRAQVARSVGSRKKRCTPRSRRSPRSPR